MSYQDRLPAIELIHKLQADAKSIRRLCSILEDRLEDGPVPCIQRELQYLEEHAHDVSKARGLLLDLWGESSTNPCSSEVRV